MVYRELDQGRTSFQTIKVEPRASGEKLSTKFHFESKTRALFSGDSAGAFMYANYKGRHDLWQQLLEEEPYDFDSPTLDVASGSGVSLMKVCAQKRARKDKNRPVCNVYAIDNYSRDKERKSRMKKIINNIRCEDFVDLVTLNSADLTQLPYDSDVFSLVTSPWAFRSYDKVAQRQILREMARVCKPGGYIIITDLKLSAKGPLEEWIQDMGWDEVNKKGAGPCGWFGYWSTECYKFQKPYDDDDRHSIITSTTTASSTIPPSLVYDTDASSSSIFRSDADRTSLFTESDTDTIHVAIR
ncbi:hypothetical protein CJU90_5878 [Yarrowia sp. C11]|nr:hypothetical protein CJU90_5878 [Yarrowia sp. C11]KAG5364449.1 hypothetical protein CKK34_3256 [Yarrowia sp. E02]